MKVGRKIFYDKLGNIIINTGERQGSVVSTTIEQDIVSYTALSERNRETFDVLELPFGAYAQDFAECNSYRVNPVTKKLEFSYPDPNEPETPPVYRESLSEEIKNLKTDLGNTQAQSFNTDTALMEFMDHYFERGGM